MEPLKYTLSFIYLICFLYTVFISIQKFLQKTKIQVDKSFEEAVLQYSSVTVCAEYTFKKYLDGKIESGDIDEVEKLVKSNVWKKNETFYFLNHKGCLQRELWIFPTWFNPFTVVDNFLSNEVWEVGKNKLNL